MARSCRAGTGTTHHSRPTTTSRSSGPFRAAERMAEDGTAGTDSLVIAGKSFRSRLFIGTAGYPNQQIMLDAIEASGAELVTVSIRRISLDGYAESLVDLLGDRYTLLPNTAGCETKRDAILTAQLAREALETNWLKLELIGDRETLYPDVEQLVAAADELVKDGFIV